MVAQLEATNVLGFLETLKREGDSHGNQSGNLNKVLMRDTALAGTNSNIVQLSARTEVTVWGRRRKPTANEPITSFFTVPVALRKHVVNVYPSGAIVQVSCHKRRPASRSQRRGPELCVR